MDDIAQKYYDHMNTLMEELVTDMNASREKFLTNATAASGAFKAQMVSRLRHFNGEGEEPVEAPAAPQTHAGASGDDDTTQAAPEGEEAPVPHPPATLAGMAAVMGAIDDNPGTGK